MSFKLRPCLLSEQSRRCCLWAILGSLQLAVALLPVMPALGQSSSSEEIPTTVVDTTSLPETTASGGVSESDGFSTPVPTASPTPDASGGDASPGQDEVTTTLLDTSPPTSVDNGSDGSSSSGSVVGPDTGTGGSDFPPDTTIPPETETTAVSSADSSSTSSPVPCSSQQDCINQHTAPGGETWERHCYVNSDNGVPCCTTSHDNLNYHCGCCTDCNKKDGSGKTPIEQSKECQDLADYVWSLCPDTAVCYDIGPIQCSGCSNNLPCQFCDCPSSSSSSSDGGGSDGSNSSGGSDGSGGSDSSAPSSTTTTTTTTSTTSTSSTTTSTSTSTSTTSTSTSTTSTSTSSTTTSSTSTTTTTIPERCNELRTAVVRVDANGVETIVKNCIPTWECNARRKIIHRYCADDDCVSQEHLCEDECTMDAMLKPLAVNRWCEPNVDSMECQVATTSCNNRCNGTRREFQSCGLVNSVAQCGVVNTDECGIPACITPCSMDPTNPKLFSARTCQLDGGNEPACVESCVSCETRGVRGAFLKPGSD